MSDKPIDVRIPEEGDAAAPKDKPSASVFIADDGTMIVSIPLPVMQRHSARGLLLEADDMIRGWYAQRASNSLANKLAGLGHGVKNKLARAGKLVLPS